MLRRVDGMRVNWDRMNVLLNDIWNRNFIGNFVRLQNFNFFDDGYFNDLHVRNFLRVVLMVCVIRILSFDVP